MLETRRGFEVADIWRLSEAPGRESGKLQEAIEHMNTKQNRLLATMELLQKLMSGASDEFQGKFFKDALILEEKISEVENVSCTRQAKK